MRLDKPGNGNLISYAIDAFAIVPNSLEQAKIKIIVLFVGPRYTIQWYHEFIRGY